MGQRDKRLEKWRTKPPKEAPVHEVEAVVDYYFPDSRVKGVRGSHSIKIRDRRLVNRGEFGRFGQLEIPVSGGQKVKGVYLEKLAIAVEIILEDFDGGAE